MFVEEAIQANTAALNRLSDVILQVSNLAPKTDAKASAAATQASGEVARPAATNGKNTKAAEKAAADTAKTEGIEAIELTKTVVAAVAATSREAVLTLLKEKFNVSAGKEITDPVIRKQAADALEAMVKAAAGGEGDLG